MHDCLLPAWRVTTTKTQIITCDHLVDMFLIVKRKPMTSSMKSDVCAAPAATAATATASNTNAKFDPWNVIEPQHNGTLQPSSSSMLLTISSQS